MKVLASLSILLALLAVSQATAETRSITIGKFTYLGTGTQTRSGGTVIQGVSSYELVFDTGGVTAEPIPFSINNTFVLANHEAALDPQCDAQGFCKGTSAPIVLRRAPARSCN